MKIEEFIKRCYVVRRDDIALIDFDFQGIVCRYYKSGSIELQKDYGDVLGPYRVGSVIEVESILALFGRLLDQIRVIGQKDRSLKVARRDLESAGWVFRMPPADTRIVISFYGCTVRYDVPKDGMSRHRWEEVYERWRPVTEDDTELAIHG